jgi:hypothetical protein
MRWLLLLISLLSVGCTPFKNQEATMPSWRNFFEADRRTAWAGDKVILSWDTSRADAVDIEVWGFASSITPQIRKIVEYTHLPAAGTQTITMPGFPSAVYCL